MNSAEKLRLLRQRMQEQGMDAYVVVTDDFHGSEYVGDYFKAREYLSGFTGSAGTLVVLPDSAALWTDGRYFLQAADQLASDLDAMLTDASRSPLSDDDIARYRHELAAYEASRD
mgnify:CR=1 FL=1